MMTLFENYIETALWSSTFTDDEGMDIPMDDRYSIEDLSKETAKALHSELMRFLEETAGLTDEHDTNKEMSYFVHNFWLTRNGHGAGFWDGGYSHGDELTDISESYGACTLYVGDDGKIYHV